MLLHRTGLAALALTTGLAGGVLVTDQASAKGRCAAGQFLRVSSGTCISRELAVKQGIVGKRRPGSEKAHSEAKAAPEAAAVEAKAAGDEDETKSGQTTSIARSDPPAEAARKPAAPAAMASAEAPSVRIEVVKTERRPTPAILTPTWPYGELAAFPRRVSP
jgi:hypothetical protein